MILLVAVVVGWIRYLKNRKSLLRVDRLWILGVPFGLMMIRVIFFVHAHYLIFAPPYPAIVAGAGVAGWRANSTVES